MKEKVKKALNEIISEIGWDVDFELEEPPQEIKADLSTILPLLVSKKYNISPQEAFDTVKKYCKKHFGDCLFKEIWFSEPGFINFVFSFDILFEELKQIIKQKENYPVVDKKNENVLIEFVSANPTGPLHIGHGRCAVLGDVLGNILKKLGYNLTKEYYVNDRGKQITVLVASVIQSLADTEHYSVEENLKSWAKEISQKAQYKGEYIKTIAKMVKTKFGVVSSENINEVQKFIITTIMDEIKTSLKNFNVEFDNYFYETSLYETGVTEKIKKILEEKKLVEHKDGAVWFKSSQVFDNKDRVIIKSDGEPTYFFSDIAYHYNKASRGYTWLINIWGTDHHGYVDRIKSACDSIFSSCFDKEIKLDIILYQLVTLVKQKQKISMSTREGKFVSLDEVVSEVGVDVTRFFLLTKSPNAHLEFDFDLAKEHSLKNPVYYIQYAHTRCCGIINEVNKIVSMEDIYNNFEYFFKNLYEQKEFKPEEITLVKKLCFYYDALKLCIETMSVHHLCNYLIELASLFHRFYEQCRVIDKNSIIIYPRLMVVIATKIILNNALTILGISSPEKM